MGRLFLCATVCSSRRKLVKKPPKPRACDGFGELGQKYNRNFHKAASNGPEILQNYGDIAPISV
jgi:hypothetical protein